MAVITQTKVEGGNTVRYTDTPGWRFLYIDGDSETDLFYSEGETILLDSDPRILEEEPTEEEGLSRLDVLSLTRIVEQ